MLSVLRPLLIDYRLSKALQNNDYESVKLYVAQGANPNLKPEVLWQTTPIEMAVKHRDSEGLRFLISRGADVNRRGIGSGMRESPLMLAVRNIDLEAVQLLLSNGADVHAAEGRGWSLLENPTWFGVAFDENSQRRQQRITALIKQAAAKSSMKR